MSTTTALATQGARTETVASVSAQLIASAVADGRPVPEQVLEAYRRARADRRSLGQELIEGLGAWAGA